MLTVMVGEKVSVGLVGEKVSVGLVALEGGGFGGEGGFSADGVGNTFSVLIYVFSHVYSNGSVVFISSIAGYAPSSVISMHGVV